MHRRWMLLFLAGLFLWAPSLTQAQTSPTMDVLWTNYLAEFDNYHSGPERVFRYTIHNTSPPSTTNNLVYLQLPTGLDAGLFYAWFDEAPLDWETWYGGPNTGFSNTNTPIAPGSTATLEVRTESLITRFDYVTALAAGPDFTNSHPAFTPVLVEVPAGPYPPPTLTALNPGANAITLLARDLRPNYHYTLEQSAELTSWTNAAEFWLTFADTNLTKTLTLPLPPNSPRLFFRLRSP